MIMKNIREGTVADYNKQAAHQYPEKPYYNRDTTDKDIQDEFDSNLTDLKKFSTKLKSEVEKGVNPKLHIDGESAEEVKTLVK
jgi:hypothetical protein